MYNVNVKVILFYIIVYWKIATNQFIPELGIQNDVF